MASQRPTSAAAYVRRLVPLALLAVASMFSACISQGNANADPGTCANGTNDGGNVIGDGNTTSISIDSGNVFAPNPPGSTSNNSAVGNISSGNGTGSQTVCCVHNVCCVHAGGGGDTTCPPG